MYNNRELLVIYTEKGKCQLMGRQTDYKDKKMFEEYFDLYA